MKKNQLKLMLSVFLSFALLSLVIAQQTTKEDRTDRMIEIDNVLTVKGIVTTFNNSYLMNTKVTAKKTTTMTFSDSLGRFEIVAQNGDVLIFKANGFETKRVNVSPNEEEISVSMVLKQGKKYERMAIDNGHINLTDIAFPARTTQNLNHDFSSYSNLRGLIQAQLPEARVTDRGSIQVFIRGRDNNSFGPSENNGAALFVLDGMMVSNIDFLNPQDVTSIKLLKDAHYSVIYGSRAANGVVMIKSR